MTPAPPAMPEAPRRVSPPPAAVGERVETAAQATANATRDYTSATTM